MRAELYLNSSYDGTTWECKPLEDTLERQASHRHLEKVMGHPVEQEKDLARDHFKVTFFNDNPGVHGFPREKVTINGIEYKSEDLVENTDYSFVVVVELKPNGEVERIGPRCPNYDGGCGKVVADDSWDFMKNFCKECSSKK